MAFQNFICWDIDRVRDVMNTNAELATRDIFLAVHTEFPLSVCNPGVRDPRSAPHWAMDPNDFLQDFLSPDRRHVQIAVFGDSGSGKSHFIKWMALNIPEEVNRHVISIPRTGVSLRGIVELLLDVLPAEKARQYRDRLDQAGLQRATRDQMKDRLRVYIARAIAEDEPSAHGEQDLETALIELLPDLFEDPELRTHFGRPAGVIEQLVDHVLSESNSYVPAEERREFSVDDLPLTGIQTLRMSKNAQEAADFLRNSPDDRRLAVDIINRNLNKAIGHVLNFTGDLLVELVNGIRSYLREQGKELVLLIEDITRTQGLDLALLDALITEGNETNGLCTLRWAIAVNEGYYTRLPDTVKTRMMAVVDMDWATGGERPVIDESKLVAFASRYLNAARLSVEALHDWAAEPADERGEPPVACDSCTYREQCHLAFNSENDIGLYPFNRQAIPNMLRRRDPSWDDRFNPRQLVKEVLAEVLGTFGRDLVNDRFPSVQLLNQMGERKLPPIVADELRRRDPDHAERQLAVLELWGGEGSTVTDLPEELYVAFELTKPTAQGARQPDVTVEKPVGTRKPVPVDNRIEAIRAWGNGGSMQDGIANYIRPRLFGAIVSHIDWDNEALVQAQFAQSTRGDFRTDSISFHRQLTQAARRAVTLEIPAGGGQKELSEAAMAIEGLYQFGQHGDGKFPDGPRLLEVLANCLDQWSEHVVVQLNQLHETDGKWDPGAAAVEVLAVGAALGGLPSSTSATLPDFLNALFEEWPQEIPARSPEWRDLYQLVCSDQRKLRELALARASGTKGGQRGRFVDPSKLLPPLRHVRRRWELSHSPPDGTVNSRDDYGALARLHTRVAADLPSAAKAEWCRRTEWVDDWHREAPPGVARKHVVDAVRELLELVVEHGIGVRKQVRDSIESALADLETVQLDDARRAASTLREAKDPVRQLPELGRERGGNAMAAVGRFLPAIRDFLDEVEASIQDRFDHQGEGERAVQEYKAQIGDALRQLSHDLEVLGGSDGHVS